jgi:hypothetical protein
MHHAAHLERGGHIGRCFIARVSTEHLVPASLQDTLGILFLRCLKTACESTDVRMRANLMRWHVNAPAARDPGCVLNSYQQGKCRHVVCWSSCSTGPKLSRTLAPQSKINHISPSCRSARVSALKAISSKLAGRQGIDPRLSPRRLDAGCIEYLHLGDRP